MNGPTGNLRNRPRIRPETPADCARIAGLITEAFAGHPYSAGTEAAIVAALRRAGALTLSLVAEEDGEILGQAAFSPVTFRASAAVRPDDCPDNCTDGGGNGGKARWYGLGPVAVAPSRQKRGIGGALIREGLERLRRNEAAGCVLVGESAYYGRFGFSVSPGLSCRGIPSEYLLALSFSTLPPPSGEVVFHPGFEVKNEDSGG